MEHMQDYYDRRAPEYDDWYLGSGLFEDRVRPGWNDELWEIQRLIANLSPVKTLDAACGTGFLTRFLQGCVVGLDQSPGMLDIASARVPGARFLRGDAMKLPFADSTFDRIFTAHFYGHLDEAERAGFLADCGRVARELVVVDSALREGVAEEEHQERVLSDGSRHAVYKRYFSDDSLRAEIGGRIVFSGEWFIMSEAEI